MGREPRPSTGIAEVDRVRRRLRARDVVAHPCRAVLEHQVDLGREHGRDEHEPDLGVRAVLDPVGAVAAGGEGDDLALGQLALPSAAEQRRAAGEDEQELLVVRGGRAAGTWRRRAGRRRATRRAAARPPGGRGTRGASGSRPGRARRPSSGWRRLGIGGFPPMGETSVRSFPRGNSLGAEVPSPGKLPRVLLLADVAAASTAVAAVPARTAKIAALAELLGRAGPGDVAAVVSWLSGELTQRQIGVGYALLRERPAPAAAPSLTVAEVEAALRARSARWAGTGSHRRAARGGRRRCSARATAEEQALPRPAAARRPAPGRARGRDGRRGRQGRRRAGDRGARRAHAARRPRRGRRDRARRGPRRPRRDPARGRPAARADARRHGAPTCPRRWRSSTRPRSSTPSSTARACRCTATATTSRSSRARSTT